MRCDIRKPLCIREIGLTSWNVLDMPGVTKPQLGNQSLKRVIVGSNRSALSAFQLVGFSGPPSEPDLRLAPHPALHVSMPVGYTAFRVCVTHGEGIAAPR